MLKTFSNIITSGSTSAKCGEIFCQSARNFTIVCTFCEMKTFEFEDFLLHFRNVHFENNLLKTEEVDIQCTPYLDVTVKCETTIDEDFNHQHSDQEHDVMEEPYEVEEDENLLSFWQKSKRSKRTKINHLKHNANWSEAEDDNEEGSDNDEDVDYKPPIKKEQKTELIKQHKCEICDKYYKNAGILKAHIKRMHTEGPTTVEKRIITCPVCNISLPTYRRFDEHCLEEHGGVPCPHCEKKFRTKYDLQMHLPTHSGVKSFECDFQDCGKKFYNRRSLRNHQLSHSEFKKYICETCGYSCHVKETLRVHTRMHTGEKPYACQSCDKRFASCSLLKEHQATHQTLRTHVCDVCGASFTRQKSLYHHKHLHLGIKKFKCKVCGNAYAQASGLAGHMRKHREEGLC